MTIWDRYSFKKMLSSSLLSLVVISTLSFIVDSALSSHELTQFSSLSFLCQRITGIGLLCAPFALSTGLALCLRALDAYKESELVRLYTPSAFQLCRGIITATLFFILLWTATREVLWPYLNSTIPEQNSKLHKSKPILIQGQGTQGVLFAPEESHDGLGKIAIKWEHEWFLF
ncbi:MAG: hypothetical protein HQL32_17065, partial [Planctomycetes bacterium]|nr:hypothetical protein [Planctomycetota bacterium]